MQDKPLHLFICHEKLGHTLLCLCSCFPSAFLPNILRDKNFLASPLTSDHFHFNFYPPHPTSSSVVTGRSYTRETSVGFLSQFTTVRSPIYSHILSSYHILRCQSRGRKVLWIRRIPKFYVHKHTHTAGLWTPLVLQVDPCLSLQDSHHVTSSLLSQHMHTCEQTHRRQKHRFLLN